MPTLYNQQLSKRDLQARVGHLSQICGPKSFVLTEGKANGIRACEIRTGGGLSYTVLKDLGMDIAWAEYKGVPLAFISKSGISAPAYYSPDKSTWGSDFHGGLLTTCGLMQVGGGCVYQGRVFGTHGDISNTPAVHTASYQHWEDQTLHMGVKGTVREGLLYRENLELRRNISSVLGQNTILIQDEVENNGFERQPLMILYHMNFGFPLVDRDTVLSVRAAGQSAVPPTPQEALADSLRMHEPLPGAAGQVFFHDLIPDDRGLVRCELINPRLGWGIFMEWSKEELGYFAEWKNLASGDYVVGLEPSNNTIMGLCAEEANGTLAYIEPGETKTFSVTLGILDPAGQP